MIETKEYKNFEEFEEAFDNVPEEIIRKETYELFQENTKLKNHIEMQDLTIQKLYAQLNNPPTTFTTSSIFPNVTSIKYNVGSETQTDLQIENTKLKQDNEKQTKTYQKILQEQQNDIDQLQRNCDVFNEQMNDAIEITAKLKQEKQELIDVLRAVNNQIKQYEGKGLLVHTIIESLTQQTNKVIEKLGE